MKQIAIHTISFYQKHISPRKGYRCAHAVLHGGNSCSEQVKQIIIEDGLWRSRNRIRERFKECKQAFDDLIVCKKNSSQQKNKRYGEKKWYDNCNSCDLFDLGSIIPEGICCKRDSIDLCDINVCHCDL